MHRSLAPALLAALFSYAHPLATLAGTTETLGQARALLDRQDAKGAAELLEDALPDAEPGARPALLDLLHRAFDDAARQADAAGKPDEAEFFRDNLAILDRKPALPPVTVPPQRRRARPSTTCPPPADTRHRDPAGLARAESAYGEIRRGTEAYPGTAAALGREIARSRSFPHGEDDAADTKPGTGDDGTHRSSCERPGDQDLRGQCCLRGPALRRGRADLRGPRRRESTPQATLPALGVLPLLGGRPAHQCQARHRRGMGPDRRRDRQDPGAEPRQLGRRLFARRRRRAFQGRQDQPIRLEKGHHPGRFSGRTRRRSHSPPTNPPANRGTRGHPAPRSASVRAPRPASGSSWKRPTSASCTQTTRLRKTSPRSLSTPATSR